MDALRLQGLVFLLSTAGLAMPGCDPEPDEGETLGSTGEAPTEDGTVCERQGAHYVACFGGERTAEEATQWCEDWVEYMEDEFSQECADTYLVWADCVSKLDCAEFTTGCREELGAYSRLPCGP